MYFITVYDYKEEDEWTFMREIPSIQEARKLKEALDISFKMIDAQDRVSVYIRDEGWYIY